MIEWIVLIGLFVMQIWLLIGVIYWARHGTEISQKIATRLVTWLIEKLGVGHER